MTNVLDYLYASTARLPDKAALADPDTCLTYRQLTDYARAAGTVLAGHCSPRQPVAVFMEKCCAAVATFYGAVHAGCFYTFLDPSLPAARLSHVLQVLQPAALVTDSKHLAGAQALNAGCPVLLAEEVFAAAADETVLAARRAAACDTDPLYCNFTSGSTGVPKGVAVCHRSVIDFIEQFVPVFGLEENDIFANQAPLDFDVSVKDLYSALKTGARVELLPRSYFSFPTKLMDHLAARQVTVLVWAVSALCIVSTMKGLEYNRPEHIRRVLFSGEVMPCKHLAYWCGFYPDALFVNLYGPTEITCNCTYHVVTGAEEGTLPMGHAFANERVFLLDGDDHEVTAATPDVPGEVCVAGTALALGYYNDPERTAAAFTQNPLNLLWPERIYRTGDLARYGKDGLLYFAGRKDFQIKHMGHRIELGEIEAAAAAQPGVERTCCIYLHESQTLLLVYSGSAEKRPLLTALRGVLPQFMLPTAFLKLEQLPVTKNGKLDRAAMTAAYEAAKEAEKAEKAARRAAKAAANGGN